ncbi:YtxH domain-containing protein [Candidatus Margulisiibacteriota bacterium]
MRCKHNFLGGAILGTAMGFVLGLLLAPSSGEETRKKIKTMKEENEDLINDTKDKAETLISKTLEAIDTGFEKINTMLEERKNETAAKSSKSKPKNKK